MTEAEHTRPTTASIDRRVERVEAAQQETDRKVDLLGIELQSLSKLTELKLSNIEAQQASLSVRLDTFITRIEGMITKALETSGDIDATPLGRSLNKRLTELEQEAEEFKDFRSGFRGVSGTVRLFLFPAVSLLVSIFVALLMING